MKQKSRSEKRFAFGVRWATIALGVATLGRAKVFACHCKTPQPSVKQAFKSATAVFAGKVVKVNRTGASDVVLMQIETSWKGVEESVVAFGTGRDSASCGIDFTPGERYLVYALGTSKLQTNLCTRTSKLQNAAEDLRVLGKGTPRRREIYVGSQTMRLFLCALAGLTVIVLFAAYGTKGREKMGLPPSRKIL